MMHQSFTSANRRNRVLSRKSEKTCWPRLIGALLLIYWLALFCGTHMPVSVKGMARHGDKFLHLFAYSGLALLLALTWRACWGHSVRLLAWVFAICVVYGGVDELLQIPIPSRHGDSRDWLADVTGAVVGLAVYSLGQWFVNKHTGPDD